MEPGYRLTENTNTTVVFRNFNGGAKVSADRSARKTCDARMLALRGPCRASWSGRATSESW